MATKILSLRGMKDVQLCNLMAQLAQTVPGVTSAEANFLAQKLTLEIDGRSVAETVSDVTDVLHSHFPMVELKWLDVGSGPAPAAPPKNSMDDFWAEHFWTEERPEQGNAEKKEEKPPKPPKVKKEKPPKEKQKLHFRLKLSVPPEFLYLLGSLLLSVCLFGISIAASFFPIIEYILLAASFLTSMIGVLKFHAEGAAFRTATLLTLASSVILYFAVGRYAMIPVFVCHAGMALLFWIRMNLSFEIDNMLNIRPKKVLRVQGEQMKEVATKNVLPGDSLLIGAGTIPFDGIVQEGNGKIDRSLQTGVIGLIPIIPGSTVRCGDILQSGSITISVTGLQEFTMAAKMRRILYENSPKPGEKLPFSKSMVLILFLIEVLLAFITAMMTVSGGEPSVSWLLNGAAILLACCPCGILESTHLIRMSALARGVRSGILISGEKGVIDLARIKRVAIGYTGILTEGHFRIVGIEPVDGVSKEDLLLVAAAAVSANPQPIALAIQKEYLETTGEEALPFDRIAMPERVEGSGGRVMFDRQLCMAGRRSLLQQAGVELPEDVDNGEAIVYISQRNEYIGRILLDDSLKLGAEGIGAQLHQLSVEQVCILSGYDGSLENRAKDTLGADEAISGLSEREKRQQLELFSTQAHVEGKPLLYIGDGAEASLFNCPCSHMVLGTQYLEPTLGIAGAVIPSALPEQIPQTLQTCKRAQMASGLALLLFFAVKYGLFLAVMLGNFPAWCIVLLNILLAASYSGYALFLSRRGIPERQEIPPEQTPEQKEPEPETETKQPEETGDEVVDTAEML